MLVYTCTRLSRMNININSLGNNKTCAMVNEFYSSHFSLPVMLVFIRDME